MVSALEGFHCNLQSPAMSPLKFTANLLLLIFAWRFYIAPLYCVTVYYLVSQTDEDAVSKDQACGQVKTVSAWLLLSGVLLYCLSMLPLVLKLSLKQ